MSDSVWPHRQQPTRLPCPWDSPGKNPGVGCHFLLQCMKGRSASEVAQSCDSFWPHGLQPTRLLCPWGFLDKSTGVGCHCLLQLLCTTWLQNITYIIYLVLNKKKQFKTWKRNWVDIFWSTIVYKNPYFEKQYRDL